VVWDYYAGGDRSKAKLYVVNQTAEARSKLKVAVEFFNLDGTRKYFTEISNFSIGPNTSREAITVPRIPNLDPTYLVRGVLMDSADKDKDKVLAENVYWESTTDDDLGEAKNDEQFKTTLAKWADLSALNTMPRSDLNVSVSSQAGESNGEKQVTITLANPGNHVAFFVRAEVAQGSGESSDSGEILPIIYDDNYVTIFPHETRTIQATLQPPGTGPSSLAVRVEGYNVAKQVLGVR
jgi:exo-1,4-beta-D-glucosaminidase